MLNLASTNKKSHLVILGVIIAALGAVALGIFAFRGGDGDETTAEQDVLMVCTEDGHGFTLTPGEYAAALSAATEVTASPDLVRGQVIKLKCPQCGQLTAVRGARCPNDQTPVAAVPKDGQPPRCPKCGADPFAQPSS